MEPTPFLRVDREGAIQHFLRLVGEAPRHSQRIETGVDEIILKLQIRDDGEDQLWICKSRYIGLLAGHEGLGVVRRGELLRYESIVDY